MRLLKAMLGRNGYDSGTVHNRIERLFNTVKHARRVVNRHVKRASSFLDFLQPETIRCWIRLVHTTREHCSGREFLRR